MKKALLLMLALILCFTLVACGENDTPVDSNIDDSNINTPVDDVDTPDELDTEVDLNNVVSGEVSGEVIEEVSGDVIPSGDASVEVVSGESVAE